MDISKVTVSAMKTWILRIYFPSKSFEPGYEDNSVDCAAIRQLLSKLLFTGAVCPTIRRIGDTPVGGFGGVSRYREYTPIYGAKR
jgi:hypothetical protein